MIHPYTRCWQSNKNDNNHVHVDTDSVTDAEALLACRAYLQRKNRLGAWKDCQRRKESLRTTVTETAAAAVSAAAADPSVGFFWEDPEELIYLDKQEDDYDDYSDHDQEDNHHDNDSMLHPQESRVIFESVQDEEEGADFTSLPTGPSPERIRRSQAAKETWSDPRWKAAWYEKRWGKRLRNTTPAASKQKRLDIKIKAMPPNLFQSTELAALTEEEIEEAIRTYVVSNRKRSRAHTTDAKIEKKRQAAQQEQERREGKGPTAKIDYMFGSSSTTGGEENDAMMKDAQRKRSERAAKAYQTRLANQNQSPSKKLRQKRAASTNNKTRTVPTDVLPMGETPKEALVRVQVALESNQLPTIKDVELIVEPPKLGRRKDFLRRILNEHFDMRGKCVPSDTSDKDSPDFLFVTQCSIDQLGSFVVHNMKKRIKGNLDSSS